MKPIDHFISCDWGTSNFRLRVVNRHSLQVLAEQRTADGVKVLYNQYRQQVVQTQEAFFAAYLKRQLSRLPSEFQPLPIVISGMASANIGWRELPYADLPFDGSGKGLLWEELHLPGHSTTLLMSGVKDAMGMMRGEEVQALGLAAQLPADREVVLLLPGTHSKHLRYRNGRFYQFSNYMTGELFALLSQQSLLSMSVAAGPWNDRYRSSFEAGLSRGLSGKLSVSLFSIRAGHLLQQHHPTNNYYFLSGLLIGDELANLQQEQAAVVLAAPDAVFPLYRLGLEAIFSSKQITLLTEPDLEKALLFGQLKMLQQYETSNSLSMGTL